MTEYRKLGDEGGTTLGLVRADDGAQLMVETAGKGRPLLLMHGWSMSRRFWRKQLKGLAGRFKVVCPDLRAHGDSSKALFGLTLPQCARDVQAVIEALGLNDVVLAGWSLSGPLVLEYWRRYGDARVSALALVEMTPSPLAAGDWNTHRLAGGDLNGLQVTLQTIAEDRQAHAELFVRGMFHGGQASDDDYEFMLAEVLKTPALAAISLYSDYLLCDCREVLPTVSVPSLVAVGDEGPTCFGPRCGRHVAAQMPHGELKVFERSGHMPFWEEADAFNQALIDLAART